jgi:hypothetical protein
VTTSSVLWVRVVKWVSVQRKEQVPLSSLGPALWWELLGSVVWWELSVLQWEQSAAP